MQAGLFTPSVVVVVLTACHMKALRSSTGYLVCPLTSAHDWKVRPCVVTSPAGTCHEAALKLRHWHAGATVFKEESSCGNGTVTVTAHAASCPLPQVDSRRVQEWRTMRFNEVTRQSVAKVWRGAAPRRDRQLGDAARLPCHGVPQNHGLSR